MTFFNISILHPWQHRHRLKASLSVRALAGCFVISMVLCLSSFADGSAHPDIWFAPLQPLIRSDGSHGGAQDYFSLFDNGARWKNVAANTKYFKLYPELLQNASDEELHRLIINLAARHIDIALETPVLADTIECRPGGKHLRWMIGLAGRIKKLGGNLKALAMVGPIVDGHVSSGVGSCHSSLADVANDAFRTISPIQDMYPGLLVGEIEPLGSGPGYPNWSELALWFRAFTNVAGRAIAFFHLDVEWGHDWSTDLKRVAEVTRSESVPFGVIYDGTSMDLSDRAFSSDALMHADQVEAVLGRPPDHVIIQSWQDYPRNALPESDRSTMTGIVSAYLREHTQFVANRDKSLKLEVEDGVAIANAEVIVETHDSAFRRSLERISIDGMVPHSATAALVAIRVHTECVCSMKPANFWVSNVETIQQHRVPVVTNLEPRSLKSDAVNEGLQLSHFEVSSGQPLIRNGAKFRVSPDSPFAMEFWWQVEPASTDTGSIGIVFVGANGLEINRTTMPLRTSWVEKERLHTGANGVVFLGKYMSGGGRIFRVRYMGNEFNRPTMKEF